MIIYEVAAAWPGAFAVNGDVGVKVLKQNKWQITTNNQIRIIIIIMIIMIIMIIIDFTITTIMINVGVKELDRFRYNRDRLRAEDLGASKSEQLRMNLSGS